MQTATQMTEPRYTHQPIVGIRVDATARTGIGHSTRCIAIADAIRNLGYSVLFIVSCEESAIPFAKLGFDCEITEADEKKLMRHDADALYALCNAKSITYLLIDSYGMTEEFIARFDELFEGIRTAYIDDMYSYDSGALEKPISYGFDIIIGGDPFFKEEWFRDVYQGKETTLLVGPQYIPIRSDLPAPKESSDSQIKGIMITTGSTNPDGVLERMSDLAQTVFQGTNTEIHVVVGPKSSFKADPSHFHIHKGEPIASVMEQCQIAFSSAGITLLELTALGMPTLAIGMVDNQDATVEAFRDLDLGLGCKVSDSDQYIIEQLYLLAKDASLRKLFSRRCRSVIDDKGSERIAIRLLNICQ